MNADDDGFSDTQRAALQKIIDSLKPLAEGAPINLMDVQEACVGLEDLYAEIRVAHPAVHKLRRELKKRGLNRESRREPSR